MMILQFILVSIIGYLLGSVPFGLIVSKMKSDVDIRNYGSGRTGGTNVLRTLGRKAFVMVAVGDVLKAALAVTLASLVIGDGYIAVGSYHMGAKAAQSIAGTFAIIGHIFPVFAKFKGGRGVATFIGGLAAISPVSALFGGEILIIGAGLSGFASLGSILGVVGAYALMIPLTIIYGVPLEYLAYVLVGTLIIVIAHRDNIKRLLTGKERKLNQKATPNSSPA
jgi:acyl phosphate:glycerol-3-phosphate acyltransferase